MASLITNITENSLQSNIQELEDGTEVGITLRYLPNLQYWFMDITYEAKDFIRNGIKITEGIDLLRMYKKILPFTISCSSTENRDPRFIEDFVLRENDLYVLTREEVEEIEG